MKKLLFFLTMCALPLFSQEIVINNRPLAKVNGKTISLLDVIKKMDLTIHMNQPDIFESPGALFQFYQRNWQPTLGELVEEQLIMLDAEEKEFIKVSEGDVREEMENRYGPNIITTLSKFNLSYDEAKEMLRTELTVQQMSWFRAYSKALMSVTPETIKTSYSAYLEKSPPKEEWQYQMLTVRADDEKRAESVAKEAYTILQKGESGLAEVAAKLSTDGVKVSASNDYKTETKSLSQKHLSILNRLGVSELSQPEKQTSRDSSAVYRIFYLKGHDKQAPPAFNDVAEKIKNKLVSEAVERERKTYVSKLKKDNQMSDEEFLKSIPSNYTPFALL